MSNRKFSKMHTKSHTYSIAKSLSVLGFENNSFCMLFSVVLLLFKFDWQHYQSNGIETGGKVSLAAALAAAKKDARANGEKRYRDVMLTCLNE